MNNETLVQSRISQSEWLGEEFVEQFEPAFFDCDNKLCPELPSAPCRQRYLGFLKHRVRRNPGDLVSHIRRILLARVEQQPNLTHQALTEFFDVLGSKGQALRADVLQRCQNILTPEQAQALAERVADSDAFTNEHTMTLVIHQSAVRNRDEESSLKQAQEYLENGQVEQAQSLLELALRKEPNDAELTTELVEIYRRSRNNHAALKMVDSLGELTPGIRQQWDVLLAAPGKAQ